MINPFKQAPTRDVLFKELPKFSGPEQNKTTTDVRACPAVITWARSPSGVERPFPNPCAVPDGWTIFTPSEFQLPPPKPPDTSVPAPTLTPEKTLGDYLMSLATGGGSATPASQPVVLSPDQQPRSLLLPVVGALAVSGVVWYVMRQGANKNDK